MGKLKARNKALRTLVIVIVIGLLITAFSLAESALNLSDRTVTIIMSVLETVGLIVSLFIAVQQLGDSKEIARADFLVELNSAFISNAGNLEIYTALQDCLDGKCCHAEECKKEGVCVIDLPKVMISNYLTFFETIYLLTCNGVVTFEMIDDLFAYRFFLAVHSDFVQQKKLGMQPENFKNIFCLEYKWLQYRENVAHKIDSEGSVYRKNPLINLMNTEERMNIYNRWIKEAEYH